MATAAKNVSIQGTIITLVTAQDYGSCKNRCGSKCCADDEECSSYNTCVKGKKIFCSDGLSYCLAPTQCCGVMTCCPSNSQCCGLNTCCPEEAVCCGMSTCCPPDSTCCGFSTCCAKGSRCERGMCKSSTSVFSSSFSWYYLFGGLLPLTLLITCLSYRRRRQAILRANQATTVGPVSRPSNYNRLATPTPEPMVAANPDYIHPPPAYDNIGVSSSETIGQPQAVPDGAPPSYYELYKDDYVKEDDGILTGNTSEQTNRSEVQENSADTNRTEDNNS